MPRRSASPDAPSRSTSGRPRRRAVWLLLALAAAGAIVFTLRCRSQARLVERLRQQAFAAGITIKVGAVSVRPFVTAIAQVELAFPRAPGVSAVIDRATLRPTAGDLPAVAIEHAHVAIEPAALTYLEELSHLPFWRGLTVTWEHLSVTYANRLIGHLDLEDVRVGDAAALAQADGGTGKVPAAAPLSLVAGKVTLGERSWSDVALSLARRNQMLEIPIGDASAARAPLVVRTFPPQAGLNRWVLALAHRPASALAAAVGWSSGAVPSGLRVGGTATFNVPDDAHQAVTGRVDLVTDGWPAPDVPDGGAWMGPTIAFGARIEPARDRAQARLLNAQIATSLFTLGGSGLLSLATEPRLALDVQGSLTCAQLRGNLPPSGARTAVLDFVAGKGGGPGPRTGPERDRQTVSLRLQVDAALSGTGAGAPRLAMKLEPGCGVAGFALGAFAQLDLDAHAPATPTPPANPTPPTPPAPTAAPATGVP